MPFEINLERVIKANRDFIFDWWTDFSPSDASLAEPLKRREVISKSSTNIILRDEEVILFRRIEFDVKVALDKPNGWTAQYDSKVARAESEYKLNLLDNESTKLSYHSVVRPKGFFTNFFSPVIKFFVRRVFANEMNVFAKAIEEEYKNQIVLGR